jgi:hypothetical protein
MVRKYANPESLALALLLSIVQILQNFSFESCSLWFSSVRYHCNGKSGRVYTITLRLTFCQKFTRRLGYVSSIETILCILTILCVNWTMLNCQAFVAVGSDATTWKYIRRISTFRAKALRLELYSVNFVWSCLLTTDYYICHSEYK